MRRGQSLTVLDCVEVVGRFEAVLTLAGLRGTPTARDDCPLSRLLARGSRFVTALLCCLRALVVSIVHGCWHLVKGLAFVVRRRKRQSALICGFSDELL